MSSGETHRFLRKGVSKAFNHDALCGYTPVMQHLVRDYIQRWCDAAFVRGYRECRSLTFAIACRALLGLGHSTRADNEQLLEVFETWTHNLFSLPFNLPGSGLSRVSPSEAVDNSGSLSPPTDIEGERIANCAAIGSVLVSRTLEASTSSGRCDQHG